MSQSDYIKYKRVQRELKEFNQTPAKIPNVLNSGQYISYKEYSLENTIMNTKDTYDNLTSGIVPVVFGMVKKCADKSPTFTLCRGTEARGNRTTALPLDSEEMPRFRYPKNGTISKANQMKWITTRNSKYCECV